MGEITCRATVPGQFPADLGFGHLERGIKSRAWRPLYPSHKAAPFIRSIAGSELPPIQQFGHAGCLVGTRYIAKRPSLDLRAISAHAKSFKSLAQSSFLYFIDNQLTIDRNLPRA